MGDIKYLPKRNNRFIQSGRRYLRTGIDIVNYRLDIFL